MSSAHGYRGVIAFAQDRRAARGRFGDAGVVRGSNARRVLCTDALARRHPSRASARRRSARPRVEADSAARELASSPSSGLGLHWVGTARAAWSGAATGSLRRRASGVGPTAGNRAERRDPVNSWRNRPCWSGDLGPARGYDRVGEFGFGRRPDFGCCRVGQRRDRGLGAVPRQSA